MLCKLKYNYQTAVDCQNDRMDVFTPTTCKSV